MKAFSSSLMALAAISLALPCWSQEHAPSSARDMFFAGLEEVTTKPSTPDRKTPAAAKRRASGTGDSVRPVSTRFGVRYSVLKYAGVQPVEVSPKTHFRDGDAIRLKVQVNDDGYLYVVTQGTSGGWQLMHPAPGTAAGANAVLAGHEYVVPEKSLMRFRGPRGTEKLFLVVSRAPQQSLEKLIYAIRQGSPAPGSGSPPAAPPALLASNREIDNPLIDRLRKTYTRDLVLEDAEETKTSRSDTRGDTAVYVVNTNAAPDAVIVIDIPLIHE